VLALLIPPSAAIGRDATQPASVEFRLDQLDATKEVVLPEIDEARFLQEDADRAEAEFGGPTRFAAPHHVSLTPENAGEWATLEDGSRVWRLQVRSTGARSLNFGFTTFVLPEGAMVHAYGSDGDDVRGPYRADHAVEGQLWTPIVRGDAAVVELFVPADADFEPVLVVGQVSHDYRGFGQTAMNKIQQGWCNNDVVCPVGDPWRDEIRSEGVYTRNGSWMCSGQMMNSLNDDPPPYFLTAYHCGITTSNDHTVVIYWNYESPNCGDLCCGSLSDNQSGCVLRARYSDSDFCLVELSSDPDSSSNVYYAGWDATGSVPSSCVAIHHPGTDEKAISFNTDALQITSYFGYTTPGSGTHWRVDDWEDGTTEGGSSGSGIWDSDHRVVGQLHGGYASCSSITSDWYGRLSVSWTGGGSSSTRLRNWLDPENTGTLVIDGQDPDAIDTGVEGGRPLGAARSTLFAVRPNPTDGPSRFSFELDRPGTVEMEVFNAGGRLVSTVPARTYPVGAGSVLWEGVDTGSGPLPAGVYFVRMKLDGESAGTKKFVLMR